MGTLRKGTFFMDTHGIRKLKDEEIYGFIALQLKLKPENVKTIQIDRIEGKVYIELPTQEEAEAIVEQYNQKLELTSNNTTHTIGLFIEDGGTDIKLHHLPPRMPNEWIYEFFAEFGQVMRIKQENCRSKYFPNIPSGVRIVRLRMKSPVPSFINIRGYSTYVTYTNQIQTCRHCSQIVHFGQTCAENRKNTASGSSSYAGVLQGGERNGSTILGEGPDDVETSNGRDAESTNSNSGDLENNNEHSKNSGTGKQCSEQNNNKRPAEYNPTHTNRDKAARTTTDNSEAIATNNSIEQLNTNGRTPRASTPGSNTGEASSLARLRSLSNRSSRTNSNTRQYQIREKPSMDISDDERSENVHPTTSTASKMTDNGRKK